MAPPKVKLHKSTGKLKSIPRPSTIPSPVAQSSAPAPTNELSEADRQFELELYWCIQQLETTLSLPSVRENNKKAEETSKLINTLKSGTQPIIRKRQIMRTTFGDYRSKMAAEEQSMAINPDSVRFDTDTKQKPKHHFVKKSAILSGDKNFKFNFATSNDSQSDDVPSEGSEIVESTEPEKKKVTTAATAPVNGSKIVPSDNSFRFNFAVGSD
uniref:Uncharacterized protein n=1 Tax=Anopheles farauti TaxID=69004 RepID=A0A182Q2C6_9DIPT